MDSRLLNIVYDDPFDGNYVKYDSDTAFWSTGSEPMSMQLTETLNGILPIAPTDDFRSDEHPNPINTVDNKYCFNYSEHIGQNTANDEVVEIVTVDPNVNECTSDSENEKFCDDYGNGGNDLLDFDRHSQHSNATFRTRTDSSSIGDYESHTSDYDDNDAEDTPFVNSSFIQSELIKNTNNSVIDFHSDLIAPDVLVFDTSYQKSCNNSSNKSSSEGDCLGLQIDTNNFDLAEFITKDYSHLPGESSDVDTENTFSTNTAPASAVHGVELKNYCSDSDSDVIVDVETVEIDEIEASSLRRSSGILKHPVQTQLQTEEEAIYIDNLKSDPSWSPNSNVKKVGKCVEKLNTKKVNCGRKFSMVPNKKQSGLLKGKFTKGKNSQKSTKTPAVKSTKVENSTIHQTTTATTTNSVLKPENSSKPSLVCMEEKNECLKASKHNSEEYNSHAKLEKLHCNATQQKSVTITRKIVEETPEQKAQVVKRKLNLEEYKMRRDGTSVAATNVKPLNDAFVSYKIPKVENKSSNFQASNVRNPAGSITPMKHSEAVTSIVKTLKGQQDLNEKIVADPITVAKNKVLRMQELKKAQQMRIIDSTISAKVPRVTKLLPLKEIVKDTPYINGEANKSLNIQSVKSDYEEIIMVSISSNTDVSIPPIANPAIQLVNNATRSLLKSSTLLSTITNTFQKVKSVDNTKLSTNSLIASIQDVVVKQTLPVEDSKKPEHHGEDKIIMHLRKDRIRTRMFSVGIQTDLQPEFPPLPLLKSSMPHKSRECVRRYHKRQYRKRNDISSASSSESSDEKSDYSKSSSISRSRDNSYSSSLERIRTYDSAIGTGGYSSRSSLKHRSSNSSSYSESTDHVARGRRQRRTSYTKRSAARKYSRSPYSSSSYTSGSDSSRSPIYRRSRSRSNSHSRSRSRRSRYRQDQCFLDRNVSQPAVEERRIVYVGRIEDETTKDMLRRKFLKYGTIKQISIHFKDTGMKYGFVTFERSQDAFTAIDSSTRDPQISMYDVSFGGRRAFCRASYADLDNAGINTYQSYVFPQPVQPPKEEDSFEALLMKMKAKLKANKANSTKSSSESTDTKRQNKSNKI